jgi:hypothetical protein
LVNAADFDTALAGLNIDSDTSKGVVRVEFQADTDLDGTFGADVTQPFDATLSVCGTANTAFSTGRGTAAQGGGHPLIFANVLPGSTGILVDPAPQTTCVFDPPVSAWPVEAGGITHVVAQCH